MKHLESHSPSLVPWRLTVAVLLLALIVTALPSLGQSPASLKEPEPSAARITVLWALGVAAGLFFLLFIVQLVFFGDALQVVSHWGGFGGGLGGWRLSPSAAFLFAALVLSVLVAVLASSWPPKTDPGGNSTAAPSGTATPAPGSANPAPSPSPSPSPTPSPTPAAS